jgi:hypothetical protein
LPQKAQKAQKAQSDQMKDHSSLNRFVPFVLLWLLFPRKAQDGELNGAAAEAHCFARARSPDVDTTTTHHAARVSYQILTTVSTGFKPHA